MRKVVVLTISEAAKTLKLSESTTYKLAKNQEIPFRKVGGQWRITQAALDTFMSMTGG